MEAFGSTEWHMGADEFFFKQGPGDFKKYLAQIRSHYGAQMFWNTKISTKFCHIKLSISRNKYYNRFSCNNQIYRLNTF